MSDRHEKLLDNGIRFSVVEYAPYQFHVFAGPMCVQQMTGGGLTVDDCWGEVARYEGEAGLERYRAGLIKLRGLVKPIAEAKVMHLADIEDEIERMEKR